MSFLSPVFLWGLPLVAVPIIIHLLAKRKREVIRWGAMEFLFSSSTPRRRLFRLKDLLLMLVRAAIILAIICALSQPMVSSFGVGSSAPRDIILVVDNSMSTALKTADGTVFEQELREAKRLLGHLSGSDLLRILLASPKPAWLNDSPVSADAAHVRKLLAQLETAGPNSGAADMLEAVQRALKAPPAGRDVGRFITVLTDGQAHGWHADAPGAWASLARLTQKSKQPVALRAAVAGKASTVENLSVERMTAVHAMIGVGQFGVFTATVKNTGSGPSRPTALLWTSGEQTIGNTPIPELQPGESATLRLSQSFNAPGLFEIRCLLSAADSLALDDSAGFLLEVTQAVPVLLVEGEPKSDLVESDTAYFLAALGRGDETNRATVFQPKLISYEQLAGEDFSSFQCVVLANIARLPIETARKLARFVNNGGGLWIALGEQTDAAAFNQIFCEAGASLSPLTLGEPVGDSRDHEQFKRLVPPSSTHPATALLSDLQRLDIDKVRLYRRHQFGPDSGVSVLLRAEGGLPVAVEKNLGRGRVIVQAVPLGLAWSNLPLCHSFVVMVHEWLWYLTEPSLVKRNLQPGEPFHARRPMDDSQTLASVQTPAAVTSEIVGHAEESRLLFKFANTQFPGEYKLSFPNQQEEKFLVARDPEESNFTPLSQEQIVSVSNAGGLTFGSDPFSQPVTQRVIAQPRPFAAWLLSALLALIIAEAAIAFLVSRQRYAGVPIVAMEPSLRA